MNSIRTIVALSMMIGGLAVTAQGRAQSAAAPSPPAFDAELARTLGADQHGMRRYVLVIVKTGPTPLPQGPERDEMFRGHFANMQRLSAEGKLVLAGPLDGVDGWRGLFILATDDLDEAARLVATDPVIVKGEMIAEYRKYYGSAALMQVRDTHGRISAQPL
jgi:uncharacterized protein YciI